MALAVFLAIADVYAKNGHDLGQKNAASFGNVWKCFLSGRNSSRVRKRETYSGHARSGRSQFWIRTVQEMLSLTSAHFSLKFHVWPHYAHYMKMKVKIAKILVWFLQCFGICSPCVLADLPIYPLKKRVKEQVEPFANWSTHH